MISNIYYILKKIEEGQKLSRNLMGVQEVSILDSLVATNRIIIQDGFYFKDNKVNTVE